MTAAELASRIGARKLGRGWCARCPAHEDRRPSLTIGEGRDGRTLLHCWAGCPVENITHALGLSTRDLFEGTSLPLERRLPRRHHVWSSAEIKRELQLEAERERGELEASGIFGELLTPELNEIRRRVAMRCGRPLQPLGPSPYEGGYGGRERDPLWPILLETAWIQVCIEHIGAPILTLQELADLKLRPPATLRILAEDRAAVLMRRESRVTRFRKLGSAA